MISARSFSAVSRQSLIVRAVACQRCPEGFLRSSVIKLRAASTSSSAVTKQRDDRANDVAKHALAQYLPPSTLNPRVNPAVTTLPPLLDVSARKPDQSLFSHLFSTGRAYLSFYKTGLRHVWTNLLEARKVRARIRTTTDNRGNNALTRAEFQLLHRNAHAFARIPLFAVMVLVCGELTPLVVIYLTGAVPYQCRIPAQIRKALERAAQRRGDSWREYREITSRDYRPGEFGDKGSASSSVDALQRPVARHLARLLDAHAGFLDRAPLPAWYVRQRLKARMGYLLQDDALIARDGGVEGLSVQEVEFSSAERGLDVLEKSEQDLRVRLGEWISKSAHGVEKDESREANIVGHMLRG